MDRCWGRHQVVGLVAAGGDHIGLLVASRGRRDGGGPLEDGPMARPLAAELSRLHPATS
jgi:hypothetical protein